MSSDIIWVFKPIGWNPLDCINEIKKRNKDYEKYKFTFAGRLDPMACGLLALIKVGLNLENIKCQVLNKFKTYRFKLIMGFKSDSYDILGTITKSDISYKTTKDIENVINLIKSNKSQVYPPYSSKTVYSEHYKKKVPLWFLAKENKLPDKLPTKEIDIESLLLLKEYEINNDVLFTNIMKRINSLTKNKDFRKNEILNIWKKQLETKNKYKIYEMVANVSSGTYIRNIGNSIGGVVFDIYRTKVGNKIINNYDEQNLYEFQYNL